MKSKIISVCEFYNFLPFTDLLDAYKCSVTYENERGFKTRTFHRKYTVPGTVTAFMESHEKTERQSCDGLLIHVRYE